MKLVQVLFLAAYFGTPFFIIGCWIAFALRPVRSLWPMPVALALWLLQLAVGFYAVSRCVGGHCTLTRFEELAPPVVVVCSYIAITALLWYAWRRARRPAAA